MHQATHLNDVHVPMLLPGITVSTSPTDYWPIKRVLVTQYFDTLKTIGESDRTNIS